MATTTPSLPLDTQENRTNALAIIARITATQAQLDAIGPLVAWVSNRDRTPEELNSLIEDPLFSNLKPVVQSKIKDAYYSNPTVAHNMLTGKAKAEIEQLFQAGGGESAFEHALTMAAALHESYNTDESVTAACNTVFDIIATRCAEGTDGDTILTLKSSSAYSDLSDNQKDALIKRCNTTIAAKLQTPIDTAETEPARKAECATELLGYLQNIGIRKLGDEALIKMLIQNSDFGPTGTLQIVLTLQSENAAAQELGNVIALVLARQCAGDSNTQIITSDRRYNELPATAQQLFQQAESANGQIHFIESIWTDFKNKVATPIMEPIVGNTYHIRDSLQHTDFALPPGLENTPDFTLLNQDADPDTLGGGGRSSDQQELSPKIGEFFRLLATNQLSEAHLPAARLLEAYKNITTLLSPLAQVVKDNAINALVYSDSDRIFDNELKMFNQIADYEARLPQALQAMQQCIDKNFPDSSARFKSAAETAQQQISKLMISIYSAQRDRFLAPIPGAMQDFMNSFTGLQMNTPEASVRYLFNLIERLGDPRCVGLIFGFVHHLNNQRTTSLSEILKSQESELQKQLRGNPTFVTTAVNQILNYFLTQPANNQLLFGMEHAGEFLIYCAENNLLSAQECTDILGNPNYTAIFATDGAAHSAFLGQAMEIIFRNANRLNSTDRNFVAGLLTDIAQQLSDMTCALIVNSPNYEKIFENKDQRLKFERAIVSNLANLAANPEITDSRFTGLFFQLFDNQQYDDDAVKIPPALDTKAINQFFGNVGEAQPEPLLTQHAGAFLLSCANRDKLNAQQYRYILNLNNSNENILGNNRSSFETAAQNHAAKLAGGKHESGWKKQFGAFLRMTFFAVPALLGYRENFNTAKKDWQDVNDACILRAVLQQNNPEESSGPPRNPSPSSSSQTAISEQLNTGLSLNGDMDTPVPGRQSPNPPRTPSPPPNKEDSFAYPGELPRGPAP